MLKGIWKYSVRLGRIYSLANIFKADRVMTTFVSVVLRNNRRQTKLMSLVFPHFDGCWTSTANQIGTGKRKWNWWMMPLAHTIEKLRTFHSPLRSPLSCAKWTEVSRAARAAEVFTLRWPPMASWELTRSCRPLMRCTSTLIHLTRNRRRNGFANFRNLLVVGIYSSLFLAVRMGDIRPIAVYETRS